MTYIRRILQVLLITLLTVSGLRAHDFQESGIGQLLGIYLTETEQATITAAQLEQFDELGISIFEVTGYAPEVILDFIRDSGNTLFARQKRDFVTAHQLQKRDSLYFQDDLTLINFYHDELGGSAAAFGLFTYPDETSPLNIQLLSRYTNRFDVSGEGINLYYLSAYSHIDGYPATFAFRSVRLTDFEDNNLPSQVIHFTPESADAQSMIDLGKILEASLEEDQSIILLPGSWLVEQADHFELLEEVLKTYAQNGNLIAPLPRIPEKTAPPNWTVILLILLLGSYLIHYRMNAYYRQSLFRYFINHKFFVDNTVEYRLRTRSPAVVLFIQHLFICGLFVYIFAASSFSSLGFAAIHHNFPVLGIFGGGLTGFFFLGIAIAFILQSVSVVWIHLLNRKTRLNQSVTLYIWPLHLNLLVVFLMTAAYEAGGPGIWITLLSVVFLIIWFSSFNVAALDIARFLPKYRVLYIIFTVGIHLLLIITLAMALYFYAPLSEPLRLAFSLP